MAPGGAVSTFTGGSNRQPRPGRRYSERLPEVSRLSHNNGKLVRRVSNPMFKGMMRVAREPEVVAFTTTTPAELAPDGYDDEVHAYQLLLCSDTDAAAVLDETTPSIPILIPRESYGFPPHRLDLAQYLDVLRSKDTVDVHLYTTSTTDTEFMTPSALTGSQAVEKITFSKHHDNTKIQVSPKRVAGLVPMR